MAARASIQRSTCRPAGTHRDSIGHQQRAAGKRRTGDAVARGHPSRIHRGIRGRLPRRGLLTAISKRAVRGRVRPEPGAGWRGSSMSRVDHSLKNAVASERPSGLHLERLELREIQMPLLAPFETSFGRATTRRILIVRAFDRNGACGYGECTAMEGPFFNHETIDSAWMITEKFIAPMLSEAH